MDGFGGVERLNDPKFPPLPVIVLTSRSTTFVQRCEELGVLYVQKSADSWDELEATINKVFLEKSEREIEAAGVEATVQRATRILLVDDDPMVLNALALMLRKYQVEIVQACSGSCMMANWTALLGSTKA